MFEKKNGFFFFIVYHILECDVSWKLSDVPFKGLREWDNHLHRMAALNSIFPYRPSFYYPKTPIRPYYLSTSWSPLRAMPSERATVFNHLGKGWISFQPKCQSHWIPILFTQSLKHHTNHPEQVENTYHCKY